MAWRATIVDVQYSQFVQAYQNQTPANNVTQQFIGNAFPAQTIIPVATAAGSPAGGQAVYDFNGGGNGAFTFAIQTSFAADPFSGFREGNLPDLGGEPLYFTTIVPAILRVHFVLSVTGISSPPTDGRFMLYDESRPGPPIATLFVDRNSPTNSGVVELAANTRYSFYERVIAQGDTTLISAPPPNGLTGTSLFSVSIAPIPEPHTGAVALALVSMALLVRRRTRRGGGPGGANCARPAETRGQGIEKQGGGGPSTGHGDLRS